MIPAVGGTRLVPAPDPIATGYLLLGLRSPRNLLDDVASLAEQVTPGRLLAERG